MEKYTSSPERMAASEDVFKKLLYANELTPKLVENLRQYDEQDGNFLALHCFEEYYNGARTLKPSCSVAGTLAFSLMRFSFSKDNKVNVQEIARTMEDFGTPEEIIAQATISGIGMMCYHRSYDLVDAEILAALSESHSLNTDGLNLESEEGQNIAWLTMQIMKNVAIMKRYPHSISCYEDDIKALDGFMKTIKESTLRSALYLSAQNYSFDDPEAQEALEDFFNKFCDERLEQGANKDMETLSTFAQVHSEAYNKWFSTSLVKTGGYSEGLVDLKTRFGDLWPTNDEQRQKIVNHTVDRNVREKDYCVWSGQLFSLFNHLMSDGWPMPENYEALKEPFQEFITSGIYSVERSNTARLFQEHCQSRGIELPTLDFDVKNAVETLKRYDNKEQKKNTCQILMPCVLKQENRIALLQGLLDSSVKIPENPYAYDTEMMEVLAELFEDPDVFKDAKPREYSTDPIPVEFKNAPLIEQLEEFGVLPEGIFEFVTLRTPNRHHALKQRLEAGTLTENDRFTVTLIPKDEEGLYDTRKYFKINPDALQAEIEKLEENSETCNAALVSIVVDKKVQRA